MPRHVVLADLAGVDRRVQSAHQLEDRAERRRGVQIVLHRVGERVSRRGDARDAARDATASPLIASSRARKSVSRRSASSACVRLSQREVQLLAIVRRQQQVAHRRRPEALLDDVGNV